MADIKKTILLELGINKNQFLQEATDTTKQITELTAKQKELKAAGLEASLEYQNNVSNLKLLKQEYAEAQRNATNFERAIQEGGADGFGSLTQLQAELAVLTSAFKDLSEAGRENSEEGRAIQAATAQVTAKLKEQEEAVGNFRRNVGNYPKQIVELTQRIKELNITATNVDMGSKEFIEYGAAIKKSQEQLDQLLGSVSQNTKSISEMKSALDSLKSARLDAPIEEVGKFNEAIIELETSILKAEGKIDAFGDKEPKNKAKQSFDDLNDVLQGTIALTTAATILGADQADIEELLAKVTAANTIATNAKAIAKAAVVGWEKAEAVATSINTGAQVAYAAVVGTSTGALKLFRIALASTGIGTIVVLIGLLIANFDSVKKAVVNFVDKNVILRAVIDALLLPIRLLWEGLKRVGEYLGILSTDAEKARDKLIESTNDEMSAIEKRYDREINLTRATGKEVFEQERQKLRAVLHRCEESIKALIAKKQAEGDLGEDELKQLKELEDKKLDLLNAIKVSELQEQKKRDDEAKKVADENNKKAEDAAKKLREERQKRKDEIKAFNKELGDLEFELNQKYKTEGAAELASLDKKYKEMEAKAKGNKDQLKKIEELKSLELAQVNEEAFKKALARDTELQNQRDELTLQRLDQQIAKAGENSERAYLLNLERLAKQREMELAQADLTASQKQKITEGYQFQELQALETFNQAKRQKEIQIAQQNAELDKNDPTKSIDEKFKSQQLVLDLEHQQAVDAALAKGEATYNIERDYSQKTLQLHRDKDAAEAQLRAEYIESLSSTTSAMGELFGKQSGVYKVAFRAQQVATVANIAINTEKEISGIFAGYSALGPFGQVIAIVKAVAAGLRGGVSIAKVKAQQFATGGIYWSNDTGGMVYGPGTGTSDSVNAKLSNGESVINSRSTSMFGPILSAINVAGGGKPFNSSVSYTMPALAEGGIYDGGYSVNYQTPSTDINEIGEVVGNSLIKNFPAIFVDVQDVNDAQAKKANVDNRVEF